MKLAIASGKGVTGKTTLAVNFANYLAENQKTVLVDVDGEERWVERYGGKNPDRANSIIKVKDGFVFAGATESWGEGGTDMYVVKVDASGKQLWHNAFGGDFDEEANQVIATRDGGYLLVGTTNSDHGKLKDVYVVKIDGEGQRQWQRHYGGRSNDEGFGVAF